MTTTAAPPQAAEPTDPHVGSGTLAAKLARIMGQLHRITRDGKVEGSAGYAYASADALSDILRPALAAEGVVMLPSDVAVIDQRIDEIDKGTYTQTRYTVALRVEWTLTDGETTLTMATVGTGVDYAGKAANAAHTFARVNALKSAFHLSTGEDPEAAQHQGAYSSGASQPQGTGELPDVDDGAGVSGWVKPGAEGRIGVFFSASRDDQTGAFDRIKDAVKAIPGRRFNAEAKVWTVPAEQAGSAVVLGRHLGLTIDDALAERFPAKPADDLAPKADPAPSSGGGGGGSDDYDIPFAPSRV